MDEELKTYLRSMGNRFVEAESRLVEMMRDMQTELLRGFESFSAGQTIRL